MMHILPCLISDSVGTVEYIRDGIDSIVFQSGNVDQLKEMLEKCILGKVNLRQMGRNARQVFEENFSMEAFEDQFGNLMESI